MANLYEPDGTLNGTYSITFCIEYCRTHPGWYWNEADPPWYYGDF